MKRSDSKATQWVCKTEPRCACLDSDDPHACDCARGIGAGCIVCTEPMVEIDVDSGEEIDVAPTNTAPRWHT